ncbi:MAG: type II toxin-antitoxin system VapC family toxin [Candidatus Freyarchaeota archaeon]
MPVADTELIFALNPNDRKHSAALEALTIKGLEVLDTALLEFRAVLRARGRKASEVASAVESLSYILKRSGVREAHTLNTGLIINQAEIEEKYGLTYFDSLIAASTLKLDGVVVSDDADFDRVPGLERIPITPETRESNK